jgi:tumor protein p53-inducible protein 3
MKVVLYCHINTSMGENKMKAIIVHSDQPGQPLSWEEVSAPSIAADEVLVNIHATALNRADLMQRAGAYPPPPGASKILGLEMAGEIAKIGPDVDGWRVGERVCALLPGGGYGEQINVPQQMLIAIPDGWSYEQAAAIPEVSLTAYVNLFMEASLQPGESVLIHGGASGVGTAAIQLARRKGCRVFTTAGTPEKIEYCQKLGAELAINYKNEDFAEGVNAHTDGAGVDVILDMVGADYLARNISLLKLKGRLVFISTLSGSQTSIDLRYLMGKRLKLIGSVLRSRTLTEKIEINRRFLADFWEDFLDGSIEPIIDSVYPIREASQAHEHMRQNGNIGKIILKVR